jgi:Predicted signal-transduction protein containing cAMP-binding and CBS domains
MSASLPVVDNGQLVGMISERDYTQKVSLKGKSSKDTPVREIMTQEVVTVTLPKCLDIGCFCGSANAYYDPAVSNLPDVCLTT